MNYLIYAFGFLAPCLFLARTVLQWYSSEKANEVKSPLIYWQLSVWGALILLIYGILRNDIAIVIGQFITYPIYLRNLHLHNAWGRLPAWWRLNLLILPLLCLLWIAFAGHHNFQAMISNEEVSTELMWWGIAAQVIFTLRFVYQWIYSERNKQSSLPLGFWIMSIFGSVMILAYAFFRNDPVFFLSHMLGLIIYVRNIFLHLGKGSLFKMR